MANKYFNFDRFVIVGDTLHAAAASGVPDAVDDVKMLEGFTNSCCTYVKQVDEMETSLKLARFYMDDDAYKERITSLDRTRRAIHDGIIADLRMLERLLPMYGLQSFFSGDVNDRHQVADFCGEVSNCLFVNRQA